MIFGANRLLFLFLSIVLFAIPFVIAETYQYSMDGAYVNIFCRYNKTLKGKGFYMILSWDTDNALAYIFDRRLFLNNKTAIYRRVQKESFNVIHGEKFKSMKLAISYVKMDYQDLRVICLVKDDEGRGAVVWKNSTVLKVIDPPKLHNLPDNAIELKLGDHKRTELMCAATGFPPPVVRWRKRSTGKLVETQSFDPESLIARCELPVPVTMDQDGTYLCEAVTQHKYMEDLGLNKVVSGVRVNVHYPPKILMKERLVYTDIGERIRVLVDVTGNPHPSLSCSVLEATPVTRMRVEGQPSYKHYRYQVEFDVTNRDMVSAYPCRAENTIGSDSTTIRLHLGPSRPQITSPETTEYCDYYALRWNAISKAPLVNSTVKLAAVNASGAIIYTRMQVVPLENVRRNRPSQDRAYIYHVNNLTDATTYLLQVKACNRHRCSRYSQKQRFRTLRCNGSNKVNPKVYQKPYATHKPSNIRVEKRCSAYGFGGTRCSAPSIISSVTLSTHFIPPIIILYQYVLP